MISINSLAPSFTTNAFLNDSFSEISLENYKGKFVILFFYPADFTFVCPTELEDMADNYEKLKDMGVEVLSISTDTHFIHAAWHETSPKISKIKFPMLADPSHEISKLYGVLREKEGVADRATFVIDPEGIIKFIEVTDEPVGRNATELIRKISAIIHSRKNPGHACPARWDIGKEDLKVDIKLIGKL